jgi:hypothetical protein
MMNKVCAILFTLILGWYGLFAEAARANTVREISTARACCLRGCAHCSNPVCCKTSTSRVPPSATLFLAAANYHFAPARHFAVFHSLIPLRQLEIAPPAHSVAVQAIFKRFCSYLL